MQPQRKKNKILNSEYSETKRTFVSMKVHVYVLTKY
jgi:hypothetical protein